MKVTHVKSSFPLAVGTEISACDNDCYSSTGKSFSFISLPNSESSVEKTIQEDDISLGALPLPPCPDSPSPLAIRFSPLLPRYSLRVREQVPRIHGRQLV